MLTHSDFFYDSVEEGGKAVIRNSVSWRFQTETVFPLFSRIKN